jgi:hypothetical protein
MKYENEQVQLSRGDSPAVYSDRAVEPEGRHSDAFGLEQLAEPIASQDTLTSEGLFDVVFATLADLTDHQTPADDQTLLLRVNVYRTTNRIRLWRDGAECCSVTILPRAFLTTRFIRFI